MTPASRPARERYGTVARGRPDREYGSGQFDSLGVGPAAHVIGLIALVASALYFLSDVVEAMQGGFSDGQLWLTLIAEAAVPVFVVGLAVVQRPHIGRLGVLSAVAYAYSFVFFTGTVVYALVNGTEDYSALTDQLGAAMIIHGAVMVVAGLGFGYAVLRARVRPAWTAAAVIAGVVLVAVTQGLPEPVQLVAAGVRDLGFAGMGVALLRHVHRARPTTHAVAEIAPSTPAVD